MENFTIEVIERCKTQTELNEREKFWIKVLKSKSPNGYNLSNGGEGSSRRKNFSGSSTNFSMSKIRDLRLERGWTQEELGRMLNVQKAAVSKYEKGIATPSNEVLKKISAIFNVSTDYLFDNENSSATPVYHLATEETRLIDGYRNLNDENRQMITNLITTFLRAQKSQSPSMTMAI